MNHFPVPDILKKSYSHVKEVLLVSSITFVILGLFYRTVPLLLISELVFLHWYGKYRYQEIKIKHRIRKDKDYQSHLIRKWRKDDIEFSFAESSLYRFITTADYQDSHNFLFGLDADWTEGLTSIIDDYGGAESDLRDETEGKIDFFDAQNWLDRNRISCRKLRSKHGYDLTDGFMLEELCEMTEGELDFEDFHIENRLEYNNLEKIVTYQKEDLKEERIVPIGSSRERVILRFLNKILEERDSENRFFTNHDYVYFGTKRQMIYRIDELGTQGPLIAPDYMCLMDPSD